MNWKFELLPWTGTMQQNLPNALLVIPKPTASFFHEAECNLWQSQMRDAAGQWFSQVARGPDPMGLC